MDKGIIVIIILIVGLYYFTCIEKFSSAYNDTASKVKLYMNEERFKRIGEPIPDYSGYNKISITDTFIYETQVLNSLEDFLSKKMLSKVKVSDRKLRNVFWKGEDLVCETSIIVNEKVYHVKVYCKLKLTIGTVTTAEVTIVSVDSAEPNEEFKFMTGGMFDFANALSNRKFEMPIKR